jgi:hypothetical protein
MTKIMVNNRIRFALIVLSALAASTQASASNDLDAAARRIRNTAADMQAELRTARARMEADKLSEAAARKQTAERARQQAILEQKQRQAAARTRQVETARAAQAEQAAQAERERQQAQKDAQVAKEKAARERAALALKKARESADIRAFADDSGR